MFRMAVGHSGDIDIAAALDEVFAQCDATLAGTTPKAGLLMAAWDSDHQALIDAIHRRYPGIELAGSSTAGEMTSVLGFQQDSIALVLFAADDVDIAAGLGRDVAADPVAAAREAVTEARSKSPLAPALCIAFPTIGTVETGAILQALRAELGPGVPILGGGAAPEDPVEDPSRTASHQIAGRRVVEGGVVILLFAGALAFGFGVETGWRGVGPRARVTKVEGERVFEIDGLPAVDFFERYLGPPTALAPIANPLAVFEDPDSTAFYLRTATNLDTDSGIVSFFGAVPQGSTVQFTVAATDEIIDGARVSISRAAATFPRGGTPGGALLYSCATRRLLLGTRAGREIGLVRDTLGPGVPIAGFYCLGEIAPIQSGEVSQFHNATLVAVLLGSLPA